MNSSEAVSTAEGSCAADLPAKDVSADDGAQDAAANVLASMVHLIRTTRALAHRQTDGLVIAGTPLGILKKLAVGDARPGDLACGLQIAPSVVSRAVVPLEKAGLVERRPDPADARAWHLTLTDLGRERLRERQAYVNEQFAEIFTSWDPADVAQLATLMHRLDLAITERGDDLVSPFPLVSDHHPSQQDARTRLDQTRLDQTEGRA